MKNEIKKETLAKELGILVSDINYNSESDQYTYNNSDNEKEVYTIYTFDERDIAFVKAVKNLMYKLAVNFIVTYTVLGQYNVDEATSFIHSLIKNNTNLQAYNALLFQLIPEDRFKIMLQHLPCEMNRDIFLSESEYNEQEIYTPNVPGNFLYIYKQ